LEGFPGDLASELVPAERQLKSASHWSLRLVDELVVVERHPAGPSIEHELLAGGGRESGKHLDGR
jgi:hypothetical protein